MDNKKRPLWKRHNVQPSGDHLVSFYENYISKLSETTSELLQDSITSSKKRNYLADRVEKYMGENARLFDENCMLRLELEAVKNHKSSAADFQGACEGNNTNNYTRSALDDSALVPVQNKESYPAEHITSPRANFALDTIPLGAFTKKFMNHHGLSRALIETIPARPLSPVFEEGQEGSTEIGITGEHPSSPNNEGISQENCSYLSEGKAGCTTTEVETEGNGRRTQESTPNPNKAASHEELSAPYPADHADRKVVSRDSKY